MYYALGPDRNQSKMMNSIGLAMFLTVITYLTMSYCALKYFGPEVSNNILLDFNQIDGFLPMLM